MSSQKKPWWSVTRTRGQSLLLGIISTVTGASQLINVTLDGHAAWWRWGIAILLIGAAIYYLLAWWTRGKRESATRGI